MPVAKAREHIRAFLTPVTAVERLHVRNALGRILAEDIVSPIDVPGHDNSAMDGFAVRHADLKADADVTLQVIGTSFAGKPFTGAVEPGEAVRIMTGAVIPGRLRHRDPAGTREGRGRQGHARCRRAQGAERPLRRRRSARSARWRCKRGQPLRPAELGLIASLGIGEVSVYRKLRVAFFSTGDELVGIGGTLGPGQIFDSNRYTLYGMLTRLGCEVIDMGVIRDTPEAVEAAFATAAASADVVMTSGGVSVGDADYVKQMLDRLGEVLFWKIAMKPGRPLAFGKIGAAHFFGLPGNPVAVMVTFYQFVREALLTLMGQRIVPPVPTFKAVLTGAHQEGAGTHRVPARHPDARAPTDNGPCGSPATRAPASCRP